MRTQATALHGVVVVEPDVYGDARGFFLETWSARRYAELGMPAQFVQDNLSRSARGTLRGLHMQSPPFEQGKLVYVIEGEVFDVVLDLRVGSPSYGQWASEVLSGENRRQLYVPPGFAHGFCVTSEYALFAYKCTQPYAPEAELTVQWNDPDLGIAWPVPNPLLSTKDAAAPALRVIARERFCRFVEG